MFSNSGAWCMSWLCLCMGVVLLLRHSKARSAVCRSCDSLELQNCGLAACPEPGWQPATEASPCQWAATPAGWEQQHWECLWEHLCRRAKAQELGCMVIHQVGTQVSELEKQAASALEQNFWVVSEAQPPKGDAFTLLRRTDFPAGVGKSYKHLHKPEHNPVSGQPCGQDAKLRCR